MAKAPEGWFCCRTNRHTAVVKLDEGVYLCPECFVISTPESRRDTFLDSRRRPVV